MITIFKEGEAIYVAHGTIGTWPVGCLQAAGNGDGTVSISNRAKQASDGADFEEVSGAGFADFVDANGDAYGVDEASTVNALNALFTESGLSAPTVTSATNVSASTGSPVNYELTGDGIVGVEWGSLPSGLAVSALNRRVVTGSITSAGVYNIPVTVTNAIGSFSTTITLDVVSSFADTKSVQFSNNDYMAIPVGGGSMFARAGNGAGASDAWSLSLWVKPGDSTSLNQTFFYFGGDDTNNKGGIWLSYRGSGGEQRIRLKYGSNFNHLQFTSPTGSVPKGVWTHILITYDGGTTGASSGSLSSYYSRFKFYINGVLRTKSNSHSNFGWSAAIPSDLFRIGRRTGGNYIQNQGKVNELAVWDSDQSANVAAIYNAGVPHDLSLLATAPDNWWRMGDGDVFPTIQDNIGSSDGTLFNMTSADIVSDAP